MPPTIIPQIATSLQNYIDKTLSTPSNGPTIPGAILHIVDAKNNTLFSYGAGSPNPPSAESISIIHSLTKLVGAIAFMQLVDQGLASLDDASLIRTQLPELVGQKVLKGYTTKPDGSKEWHFEDQHAEITPRMLLNHTYGGGQTYFNIELLEYFQDQGLWETKNEATDTFGTILASPLLWQPGTRTNYGQGLDWIAVLIERITQQRLNDFLTTNIFEPLALTATGYEAGFGGDVTSRASNAGKFWPRKLRTGDGTIEIEAKEPVIVETEGAFPSGTYHTGRLGTGLVSSAADYAHLLTILLPENSGVDPVSGRRIISAAAVEEITKPQLPEHLRNNDRNLPASGGAPINFPGILDVPYKDPKGSYGLGCGVQGEERRLKDGRRGRGGGSVYWYGAANTDYWVDKEKGIVVFANANYYPFNEDIWVEFVAEVEGQIYEGLRD
ncbi:beta-lactamase family protein [Pyrenochaeta sp. DS3sAY3a]|nr:beta-lactamase family protein [Pyrenochaeta sp. DS3sAY3a]